MVSDIKDNLAVSIDEQRCIGCTLCHSLLPSVIYLDGYVARVGTGALEANADNEILRVKIREAAAACPSGAFQDGSVSHSGASANAGTSADSVTDNHLASVRYHLPH